MKTNLNDRNAAPGQESGAADRKDESSQTLAQPVRDRKPPPDYSMVIYWTEVRWTGDLRSETDMELTLRRESGLPLRESALTSIAACRKSRLIENGRMEGIPLDPEDLRQLARICSDAADYAQSQGGEELTKLKLRITN
jgi:hypothetical protein